MNFFQDSDDDPPLLNALGVLFFWTQFGLGLGLFIALVIAIALLIWCKGKKNPQRADPERQEVNPEPNPEHQNVTLPADAQAHPQDALNKVTKPTISGPINNLNSALNEQEQVNSSFDSIYNEAIDDYSEPYTRNPFQGWASSFRPVGPPPPPPTEAIPMVKKPVAKKDQSTMTLERDYPKHQRAAKVRSEIQSGYMASPETSLERTAGALQKQRGNTSNESQASNDGPDYALPPLPQRSSSLRRKKRGGSRRKNAIHAANTS